MARPLSSLMLGVEPNKSPMSSMVNTWPADGDLDRVDAGVTIKRGQRRPA